MKLKLGSAIFCTGVSKEENGKINCSNVFTSFLSWGYPTAIRNWYVVFTIYNLPKETVSLIVSIAKGVSGRRKRDTIATIDIQNLGSDIGSVFNIPLSYQFPSSGDFTITLQVVGGSTKINIPLRVIEQAWPTFSKNEIKIIRNNNQIPKFIRSVINCSDCSRPYTFEETFLPEIKNTVGTFPFPENGVFECESCGRLIYLKDIQGQVRSSIRKAIDSIKKGGK